MFLTRLFQIIFGYVRFVVQGSFPEKFLNLTARAGITLWNLRRTKTGLYANTLKSNYKKLLPIAEKAGVRISVIKRAGLPPKIEKHRKRYGFLLGVILFFLILWYLSGYVWVVQIDGNKTVDSREIEYALTDLGLKPGTRINTLDMKDVEQKALIKLPELSWMHINFEGSTAQVAVGERSSRPELVPDNRPCNVKATQTGKIIKMKVDNGVTMLKIGDTAIKGDLLVSGVIQEETSGLTRYVHASAKIFAQTKHDITVTVPFKSTENHDTGKVIKKYTFNLLSLQVPLYFSQPSGKFRRTVYNNPITIGPITFPVGIKTTVYTEYREIPVIYTKKQAQVKAKALIAAKESTEFSNAKIKSKLYSAKVNSNSFTLTAHYVCEEDIAYEEELLLNGH